MSLQTLVMMLTLTNWFSSSTMSTRVWYLIFSMFDDVIDFYELDAGIILNHVACVEPVMVLCSLVVSLHS